MNIIKSISGTSIRLTSERWGHIVMNHPEMGGMLDDVTETLTSPDLVTEGHSSELLAIRFYKKTPVSNDKYLVVVYKETDDDGFVITAYFTRKFNVDREIVWKR